MGPALTACTASCQSPNVCNVADNGAVTCGPKPSSADATSCPTGSVLFNGNCIASSGASQQTQTGAHSVDQGGVCSSPTDCAGNLTCQSGFCQINYSCSAPCGQKNGLVQQGGQCAYNFDCADTGGTQFSCLNGMCEPDEGTVTQGSACEVYANGDNNCFGGLACISGICQIDSSLQGGTGASGGTGGSNNTGSSASLNTSYIQGYANSIEMVINSILVPLLIAIAFIVFLWGVFNYFIRGAADPKSRTEGAQFIMWAVIGFVVIFSVWGIVQILMGTLSLTAGSAHPKPPTL